MLQFTNGTPFKGTILLLPDAEGIESLYTILKATFTLDGAPVVAEEQVPVTLAAEHRGNAESSSIVTPSDISLMKTGTDVLLVGHAYAPDGRPVSSMDVSVTVGDLHKTVRVIGDRYWRSLTGVTMSAPEPFEMIPLIWERAYGGSDRNGEQIHAEARNPVGLGFRIDGGQNSLDGLLLPNLEDPQDLIAQWSDRPAPACFAPVAPHWEPRRSFAGTYDDAWQRSRAPYLPDDFDPRFFQLASTELVANGFLEGGERIDVRGATASGWLGSSVPIVNLTITYLVDGQPEERPAVLDTVIIEPDLDRLQLVWRAVLPCDKKALRVNEVQASIAGGREP